MCAEGVLVAVALSARRGAACCLLLALLYLAGHLLLPGGTAARPHVLHGRATQQSRADDLRQLETFKEVKRRASLPTHHPGGVPSLPAIPPVPAVPSVPAVPTHLVEALEARADPRTHEVILSVVDMAFVDFALNFAELSLARLGLRHHLLVCLDRAAGRWLRGYNVSCLHLASPLFGAAAGRRPGDFGTAGYQLKTNMKTLVVLHALRSGFTVLIVDLDVIFLKNPLPYLTCTECDVQIQQDRVHLNTGFVYVRPTAASRALYGRAWALYTRHQRAHDQAYVNMAVSVLEAEGMRIRIERLSPRLFPCGAFYFRTPTTLRMFAASQCADCVIVHNNYIGSTAAKRYRFKENELWAADVGGYYSDPSARYLVYDNPEYWGAATGSLERRALRSGLALSAISGRRLVLPAFHCCDCAWGSCGKTRQRCSLLAVLKVRTFDEAFDGQYREHAFLRHPKVPAVFKSRSPDQKTLLIRTAAYTNLSLPRHLLILTPSDPTRGATSAEVRQWLAPLSHLPVVYFYSLYDAFHQFTDPKESADFESKVHHGFQCTSYDQWEVQPKR